MTDRLPAPRLTRVHRLGAALGRPPAGGVIYETYLVARSHTVIPTPEAGATCTQ